MSDLPRVLISLCKGDDRDGALTFHVAQAGSYIWPRTWEEFKALVDEQAVFVAKHKGKVIGLCYVNRKETKRWEFGGICVEKAFQGRGIAEQLGRLAIATACVVEELPVEFVAHVHEFNQEPRPLLLKLGFHATGRKESPEIEPPDTMQRNSENKVVGDLFCFKKGNLLEYSEWLAKFEGVATGKAGKAEIEFDAMLWRDRETLIPQLREISGK